MATAPLKNTTPTTSASVETVSVDASTMSDVSTYPCGHIAPLATLVVNRHKVDLHAFRKCPLCTDESKESAATTKAPKKSKTVTDAKSIIGNFIDPVDLDATEERVRKGAWWSKRGKDNMEDAFMSADTRGWSMCNPPRIVTISLRPKRKDDFRKHFPNLDRDINKFVELLKYHYESFWGHPLLAMVAKEMDENQLPHLHLLMVIPTGLSNGPRGRGAKYGHLNDIEFWEWLEFMTGELTGLPAKTKHDGTANLTWVPQDHEMGAPQDDIYNHVKVFVIYARKEINDELRAKARTQHKMPDLYIREGVKRINWFYLIGFESREDVLAAKAIYTTEGLHAVRDCMHEFAGAPVREFRDMIDTRTGELARVDVSYYSNERFQPRGGTLRGGLTDAQLDYIINMIDLYNEIDPLDRAAQAARVERRELRREARDDN